MKLENYLESLLIRFASVIGPHMPRKIVSKLENTKIAVNIEMINKTAAIYLTPHRTCSMKWG